MSLEKSELAALSPAQQEIMEIVWEHGELSAKDVRQILSGDRELARNTVRTLLERMEEKGWLTHREEGRTYLYSAAQPRQTSIGQKVVEVLDNVCGGSRVELMTALLDYRGLTAAELNRIRKMLDVARTKKKPRK